MIVHQSTHHHRHHSHNHNHLFRPTEEESLMMDPGLYNQLRGLQRSARDLRQEVKVLKRLTQLQSMAMKDLVQDTYLKLREACIAFAMSQNGALSGNAFDLELWRVAQDEEIFQKELNELVRSISHLEAKVEETRSGVINKKNKIHLSDMENMALILSKSSKTVIQLKRAFPTLEANLRSSASFQQQKGDKQSTNSILVTEDFLKRTPERLDNVWKRCKKLTGTLVTLKRLASVQEQRIHPGSSIDVHHVSLSPTPSELNRIPASDHKSGYDPVTGKESTLDDLLDALQNYSGGGGQPQPHHHYHPQSGAEKAGGGRQLAEAADGQPHVTASPSKFPPAVGSNNFAQAEKAIERTPASAPGPAQNEADSGLKQPPPVAAAQDRKQGLSVKGAPPPPPPRTSSNKPSHTESVDGKPASGEDGLRKCVPGPPPVPAKPSGINSLTDKSRQDLLEVRHQELLQRQKQLQEQYQRLQDMQQKKTAATVAATNSLAATIHQQNQNQQQQQQQQQLQQQSPPATSEESEAEVGREDSETPAEDVAEAKRPEVAEDDLKTEAAASSANCLSENFPFADSSLRDGDSSSDSASASNEPNHRDDSPKSESNDSSSNAAPNTDSPAACRPPKSDPPPAPPTISEAPVVKSSNGKIPPEVPARKSKEGNAGNGNTKVYHSEII
jgi:hypothetical protein